ncbi:MAG TPA: hypothetical protein VL306_01935 [Methylomirabilota bacterium]|nr:hypothetical protein [Methylomirabilota bacterium]
MRDLTLAIPQGFGKRKTKSLDSTSQINLLLLGFIVVLGLSYLFVINSLSTKGYEIKKLQTQLNDLQSVQKSLQVQASNLQSIDHIQEAAQALNFVPSTNVTYVNDSSYAFK